MRRLRLLAMGFLAIQTGLAFAQASMLRVACGGDAVGAEVFVNEKFRGECPIDVQVSPGTVKLRVVKKSGSTERVFEQEIRFGEGTIKKVEAILSSSGSNAQERETIAKRAEARGSGESRVPGRPSIVNPVSEEIWGAIEASDAYRNSPKPRTVRITSHETVLTEFTGSQNSNVPTSGPKAVVKTTVITPISEHCSVKRVSDGSDPPLEVFKCGLVRIGNAIGGKPTVTIARLVQEGSLFPMREGASSYINESSTGEYVSSGKSEHFTSTRCEVRGRVAATEADPRLAGMAWKISCVASRMLGSSLKSIIELWYDYYLEDLGVMLSDIGELDMTKKQPVIPTPGSRTVWTTDGDFGSRITKTFSSYEWAVDK